LNDTENATKEPSYLSKLASKVPPSIAGTTLVLVVFLIMLPFYLERMMNANQITYCLIILAVILFAQLVTIGLDAVSDFYIRKRRTEYTYPKKQSKVTVTANFESKTKKEVRKAVESMKGKEKND
jgi:tetrahydromethanopterin S-methyltransferase subunit E